MTDPTDGDERDDEDLDDEDRADELEHLAAAGLYDADAADAPNVRELLEYLLDLGMSIPEIVQARDENRLMSSGALRMLLSDGPRTTLTEAAATADVDAAFALRVWRAAGFPDPRPHERRFSEGDVQLFRLAGFMSAVFTEDDALQLVRTFGGSVAQIADAEVALLRARIEAPMVEAQQWREVASAYVEVIETVLPQIGAVIDTLHRHHIDAVARRYNDTGMSASATNVVRLAVGFADLAGYTGLSQQLDARQLGLMLARFEGVTGDVVAAAGAQVIKRIGDAVMFVTSAPGIGCLLALELMSACAEAGLPKLRIGLAFGEVIARQGDCYGPTVNLAARLVAAAEPGVVLTDVTVRDRLASVVGDFSFHRAGRYTLQGYEDPVEVFQLLRA